MVIRHGTLWAKATAQDILIFDNDTGLILDGVGWLEVSAVMIHSAIHRVHTSRKAVFHVHMPYATALTSLEDPRLLMINQNCLRFYDSIAYDVEYRGIVEDNTEGDRIASRLQRERDRVLFMANHGIMVTGESLANAFDDLYYLERACMNQVLALQTSKQLKLVPHDICERARLQMLVSLDEYAKVHFDAQKRVNPEPIN